MKMRSEMSWLIATFTIFACSNASADPINIDLDLENSQIVDNWFSNDTWYSELLDLGEVVILEPNQSVTVNITFKDGKCVRINDGYFNGDESIRIVVDGEGGTGGAPNNKADFSFQFTGVTGTLLTNPITQVDLGQITINPLNGNVDFDKSIDLINGGILTFKDLHLTITNRNVNNWQFDKVGVGVDGDDVSVCPEPSTIALLLFGGIVTFRKRIKGNNVAGPRCMV
jgi:hypothetical protein